MASGRGWPTRCAETGRDEDMGGTATLRQEKLRGQWRKTSRRQLKLLAAYVLVCARSRKR
eukprot:763236-Hanusia_phi.AAC.1